MSDVWYYSVEGKPVGPLTLGDLTAILSRVSNTRDVLVWQKDFEHWKRAAEIPELVALLSKSPSLPPLPPPLPPLPPALPDEPSIIPSAIRNDQDHPQYQKVRVGRTTAFGMGSGTIAAIVLSVIFLVAWQYFFAMPQEIARQKKLQQEQAQQQNRQVQSIQELNQQAQQLGRATALAASPRIPIKSDSLQGSIALKGARIDDLVVGATESNVPPIAMLSPSGSSESYYAEFGWVNAAGASVNVPTNNTLWSQSNSGSLSVGHPVTLTFDNGQGQEFRRTIAVDDKYLFTIKDEVVNKSDKPITLYPFALISRHGTPKTLGYYISHEGMIGKFGDKNSEEVTYKSIAEKQIITFNATNAWLGITDKYWATVLLPKNDAHVIANFKSAEIGNIQSYQTDYLLDARTIGPGATGSADARLFAGAKEVHVINNYDSSLHLNHFDLLIDWGWFYFITKPLFFLIDYFYHLIGNFGVAILIVTTIVKLLFVPFANQSYRSMIKMQRLQPKIAALRERFPEQGKFNKELIELYKRENVTAPSGCLPVIIQTLVVFSLYKLLFVTVEAHSPFYGWIHDLAAPDPTNVFNLFGLIPFDPMTLPVVGTFLHVGAWPIILGFTIWQLQRNISPSLLGSFQRNVYSVLPLIVIYFSANMMAGMLIYFTWYNILSIIHQLILMRGEKGVVGNISKYSAEGLLYGKIQPIVFLMSLAPFLQNLTTLLVFWRRSKTLKTESETLTDRTEPKS